MVTEGQLRIHVETVHVGIGVITDSGKIGEIKAVQAVVQIVAREPKTIERVGVYRDGKIEPASIGKIVIHHAQRETAGDFVIDDGRVGQHQNAAQRSEENAEVLLEQSGAAVLVVIGDGGIDGFDDHVRSGGGGGIGRLERRRAAESPKIAVHVHGEQATLFEQFERGAVADGPAARPGGPVS